jgi:hypothetical protein
LVLVGATCHLVLVPSVVVLSSTPHGAACSELLRILHLHLVRAVHTQVTNFQLDGALTLWLVGLSSLVARDPPGSFGFIRFIPMRVSLS